MAVLYFYGARSGIAKKSGDWFGCIKVLGMNQYHQPDCLTYWVSDKDTFDVITADLPLGAPVFLSLRAGDLKVVDLSIVDGIAPIDFTPLAGS